ncbi:hypothetical protein VOLCADRAFT_89592 [Volvox carteri f. nagariensis]|uniref:SGNH hydrolase-type esterase domain-containing protein n=1 Tax=Volvox carteri f. nagariensis TaxID=3068 RepID=D8TS89_VOLCA|nr:uncharacterized protein VOLCADRAFT_89592 [Volvox carteri f. nagariensis]EFJ49784.1 hypothetical protein VOLCADRAFT_89592 [Volvox carteri f. nagariensis]|eukprot:XP_002949291.1 hypothetical protein VOLCADRAFT_89592 [Volvox carteri f. nagariensis]
MSDKPVVLCLGDSHTLGVCGAPWVPGLAAALPRLRYVNTGVNGTQAKNVHSRLEKLILGVRGKLAGVTLLIGTNDCLLALAQETNDFWGQQHYMLNNGYTGPANVDTFRKQYRELTADIAERLRQRAAASGSGSEPIKLMIVTLPPIGEALDDKANKRVDEYNTVIREATAELQLQQQALDTADGLRIILLDLSAACKAAIERAFGKAAGDDDGGSSDATGAVAAALPPQPQPLRLPSPHWRVGLGVATCMVRRYVFGISYEQQSRQAGTVVLAPDCIHLNETGARLLIDLVEGQLRAPADETGPGPGSNPAAGTRPGAVGG